MNVDLIYRIFARSLFFLALAILAIGFVELVANLFGTSVMSAGYTAGRMFEVSAAMMVFVIAVLLRQIRDALKHQGGD